MNIHENLTLVIYEKPGSDYKYLFSSYAAQGYTAFRTLQGFKEFMYMINCKLEPARMFQDTRFGRGMVRVYKVVGTIKELSFWNLDQVPEDCDMFMGLSNGSMVECYWRHTADGAAEIYRPNPNAKDVYKPLPLDKHIALRRKIG